jgi:cell division protein FtsI/penicillin-binding protein 2
MLFVSAAITSRLIYIQVMNSDYWRAFAQGQQNIFENVSGDRGKIYFSGSSLPVATKKHRILFIFPLLKLPIPRVKRKL